MFIPPEPVFKTRGSKFLTLIVQMVRAFGMNPNVGDSSPSQVETFRISKTLTLSQEHPFVRVSKMNAVARAQLTFQMLTLLKKKFYITRASVQNMGQQMSGHDSSNG